MTFQRVLRSRKYFIKLLENGLEKELNVTKRQKENIFKIWRTPSPKQLESLLIKWTSQSDS